MNPAVSRQFRVKSRQEIGPCFDEYRRSQVTGKNLYVGTKTPNNRRSDENSFIWLASASIHKGVFRLKPTDRGMELPAVGIALNADVDQTER